MSFFGARVILTPGNDFPEFSQSRTKLRQRLLTLPPRRPKDMSPTRTPAGDLRSGRRRGSGHSLESRAEHPSTENQEVISGPSLSFVRPDADFFPTPVGHPLSGARETWLAPNGLRNLSIRDSTAMARSPELAPVPAAGSGEPLGTDAEPGPSLSDGVRGPSHPPGGCSVTRPPSCCVTRPRAWSRTLILHRFASLLAGG